MVVVVVVVGLVGLVGLVGVVAGSGIGSARGSILLAVFNFALRIWDVGVSVLPWQPRG